MQATESGAGYVAKKGRQTTMTMEVSGVTAQQKNVCDVLVDIALQQIENERAGQPELTGNMAYNG